MAPKGARVLGNRALGADTISRVAVGARGSHPGEEPAPQPAQRQARPRRAAAQLAFCLRDERRLPTARSVSAAAIGFGRIAVSKIKVSNIIENLV